MQGSETKHTNVLLDLKEMIQNNKAKVHVFRMLKWISLIVVILGVIIYFLNQGIKSRYCGFWKLYKDSIEYIVIYKFNTNSVNEHQDSVILSNSQTNRFVSKWNNSYPIGSYKYLPKYTLSVRLTNGKNRDYRISGANMIKENNDFCFGFIFGESFFKSIWNKYKD